MEENSKPSHRFDCGIQVFENWGKDVRFYDETGNFMSKETEAFQKNYGQFILVSCCQHKIITLLKDGISYATSIDNLDQCVNLGNTDDVIDIYDSEMGYISLIGREKSVVYTGATPDAKHKEFDGRAKFVGSAIAVKKIASSLIQCYGLDFNPTNLIDAKDYIK